MRLALMMVPCIIWPINGNNSEVIKISAVKVVNMTAVTYGDQYLVCVVHCCERGTLWLTRDLYISQHKGCL